MKKDKDKKVNKVKQANLLPYLAKYKFPIFMYIFCVGLAGACSIFDTIFLARAIEQITLFEHKTAVYMLLLVMVFTVSERLFTYFSNYFYHKYSCLIMEELSLDLAKQAFKLNSSTYNNHDTGMFVQRIVTDPERVIDKLANIVDYVADFVTALVMVIYILTLNIWIALIVALSIFIGSVIEINRTKTHRKYKFKLRRSSDKINSLTTEIVRSEKDVKSLGMDDELSEVSRDNYSRYRDIRYKTNIVDVGFWTVRDIIIKIMSIGVLILGVWLIDLGLITLATFMIVYSNNNSLISLVRNIGRIGNNFVDIKVSCKRMFSLFDEFEFETEKFGNETIENVVGEIEFRDVCFSFKEYEYPEIEDKNNKKLKSKQKVLVNEKKILNGLNFKIKPNTTVAFVGKSGSGKSTILNLISKMYEADSGEVLIDGVEIKNINKDVLRNSISLVNQFPYIFDMTIKENLLLANSFATDEEINETIKKASLEDFIASLPNGLDTRVGEGGVKLSGGQKQRLAIARALLRNSSIIIFDESTSSLDNIAQSEIKKSIDGLKGKGTIIIVAHRLSTIKNVDHIFFLEDGKISDEGTFNKLYKSNKEFKKIFLAENIE